AAAGRVDGDEDGDAAVAFLLVADDRDRIAPGVERGDLGEHAFVGGRLGKPFRVGEGGAVGKLRVREPGRVDRKVGLVDTPETQQLHGSALPISGASGADRPIRRPAGGRGSRRIYRSGGRRRWRRNGWRRAWSPG